MDDQNSRQLSNGLEWETAQPRGWHSVAHDARTNPENVLVILILVSSAWWGRERLGRFWINQICAASLGETFLKWRAQLRAEWSRNSLHGRWRQPQRWTPREGGDAEAAHTCKARGESEQLTARCQHWPRVVTQRGWTSLTLCYAKWKWRGLRGFHFHEQKKRSHVAEAVVTSGDRAYWWGACPREPLHDEAFIFWWGSSHVDTGKPIKVSTTIYELWCKPSLKHGILKWNSTVRRGSVETSHSEHCGESHSPPLAWWPQYSPQPTEPCFLV